jgi:hypothetical protein
MRWPYPRKPSLGRDLPSNYAEGRKVFDERVKGAYPIGMSEADLVGDLRSKGYSIEVPANEADWGCATILRGVIFQHIWSVRWRARAGKIDDIWGVYGVIAP